MDDQLHSIVQIKNISAAPIFFVKLFKFINRLIIIMNGIKVNEGLI